MKISVIIPTYNRYHTLHRTFSFLACSDIMPDEVIVIDQSQNLDLANKIKELCFSQKFNTKYIWLSEPSLTKARNVGMDNAQYDLMVFMDDDVDVRTDTFSCVKDIFSDDSVALVGGIDKNLSMSNSASGYLFGRSNFFKRYKGHVASGIYGRFPIVGRCIKSMNIPTEWAMGFFFVIRKELVVKWNLRFNENFRYYAYAEDLDFTYSYFEKARQDDLKCYLSLFCTVNHNVSNEYRTPQRSLVFMMLLHREYIRYRYFNKTFSSILFYWSLLGEIGFRIVRRESLKDFFDALIFMRKYKNDIRKGNFHYDLFFDK